MKQIHKSRWGDYFGGSLNTALKESGMGVHLHCSSWMEVHVVLLTIVPTWKCVWNGGSCFFFTFRANTHTPENLGCSCGAPGPDRPTRRPRRRLPPRPLPRAATPIACGTTPAAWVAVVRMSAHKLGRINTRSRSTPIPVCVRSSVSEL